MTMALRVLGSSSAGNSTVVWNESSAVMIDCGFTPAYLQQALADSGLSFGRIGALLLTHLHEDHVNPASLSALLAQGVPVYAPGAMLKVLAKHSVAAARARDRNLLRPLDAGLEIGAFEVSPFPVPHDAPGGCFGYALVHGEGPGRRKVAIATDIGYVRDGMAGMFADADALVIESNHDPDMLEQSGRPDWLKRRIREIGHLSNPQCAAFMVEVVRLSGRPPAHVLLAHISRECNTRELARRETRTALDACGHTVVQVEATFHDRPGPLLALP